jgi:hypothetical protein
MKAIQSSFPLMGALVALAMVGCASAPPATDKLAIAKRSIERAEQAGATQSAPTELSQARDKLAAADKASADRDAKTAVRLADQADVDGRLAEAAAVASRSRRAATELDASVQAMRDESMRSQPEVKQ